MIARAFNITIATASMPYTVRKAMHQDVEEDPDAEKDVKDEVSFCCWEWLAICKKKENGDLAVMID